MQDIAEMGRDGFDPSVALGEETSVMYHDSHLSLLSNVPKEILDLAPHFSRAYGGGREAWFVEWLNRPHPAYAYQTPIQVIRKGEPQLIKDCILANLRGL